MIGLQLTPLPENRELDRKVLFLVILFTLFVKLVTTVMIETGGDAATVWFHIKRFNYGLPYVFTHQTTRFGMVFPVLAMMKVFGSHPLLYYVVPFLSFLLLVIFLYKIGVRIAGRNIALTACILLNIFPYSVVGGLQLLPDYLAATGIVISFYLILKSIETGNVRLPYFIAASALFFWGYGTKITALFYLPGFFIVIWLFTKKFRYVVIFGGILLGLFLAETLFYYIQYGYPLGQLSIIKKTHVENPIGQIYPLNSVIDLLGRFTHMAPYWKIAYYAYFAAIPLLLLTSMKKNIACIVIISLSFVFFQTFSIVSVNPIVPTQPFNDRHMTLGIPFAMLIISYVLSAIKDFLQERLPRFRDRIGKDSLRFPVVIVSVFSIFTVAAFIFALTLFPDFTRGNFFTNHPFALIVSYNRILDDAYKNRVPIIMRKIEPQRFVTIQRKVSAYLSKGKNEGEACRDAGYSVSQYRYALERINTGDYKSFLLFTSLFWDDMPLLKDDPSLLPEMDKIVVKGKPYGLILHKEAKIGDYMKKITEGGEREVIEIMVKPFTVRKIKLNALLGLQSPLYL